MRRSATSFRADRSFVVDARRSHHIGREFTWEPEGREEQISMEERFETKRKTVASRRWGSPTHQARSP